MIVRRVGPMSCGKVLGIIYAVIGLFQGALFSLMAMGGVMLNGQAGGQNQGPAVIPLIFGAGAIVIVPLFMGVMGFLGGLITALVYNIASSFVGGIEIDVDTRDFQRD